MLVGYARVSTVEQNEGRQVKALTDAGCSKLFIDKCSGKNTNRPKLKEMMEYLRDNADDVVIVEEYSRLARSTRDLLDIIESLNNRGIQVKSLKETLDTSTPEGELILKIFASIAEFERKLILQRQAEGIALAKEQGKYKGRKSKNLPPAFQQDYEEYTNRKITIVKLVDKYGVSKPTIYKWIKELKGEHIA